MHEPFNRRRFLTSLAATGALLLNARGSRELFAEASDTPSNLDWFLNARYGLFIHWGPYAVAGVEASWPLMVPGLTAAIGPDQLIAQADYEALAERFDPQEFDAREWVRFAERAGMRYMVITAKHHDGYCLFDSPSTNYKITRKASGRDLLLELAEACAEASFPLGFYYSPPDMHHPGYRDTTRPVIENWMGEPDRPEWSLYLDAMEADLEKLLTDYGDVAIVWFDGLFDHARYDPPRLHRLIRRLQPQTLINDRLGRELGDYITPEQNVPEGVPVRPESPPPAVTAEQFEFFIRLLASGTDPEALARSLAEVQRERMPTAVHPDPTRFQPWETCMTLGVTWAHDPKERLMKSAETVARTLVEVTSRGGNLLLNVGPMADGRFPSAAQERLHTVGRWLREIGSAIYGTTYGPLQGHGAVRTTISRDDQRLFVHVLEQPRAGSVRLAGAGSLIETRGATRARRVGASPGAPAVELAFDGEDVVFDIEKISPGPELPINLPSFELL